MKRTYPSYYSHYEQKSELQRLLIEEFTIRTTRNPAYSLRAFARHLGVNKTSLSEFLSGKRRLSARNERMARERIPRTVRRVSDWTALAAPLHETV